MFKWEKGTIIWATSEIDKCAIDSGKEPEFFKGFRKKSYDPEMDISRYHVGGKDGAYVWDPDIYKDARHGLILRYNGRPIAVTCFSIIKPDGISFVKPDTLEKITDEFPYIVQLQGVMGSSEYLEDLKWERMLVAVVERLAQEVGFHSSGIQPASKNSEMYHNKECVMRYDVTAKRSGYKMQNGIWIKGLAKTAGTLPKKEILLNMTAHAG